MENEKIEREILEAVQSVQNQRPEAVVSAQQVLRQTQIGNDAQSQNELWRIRRLGEKRMLEVMSDQEVEMGIQLSPLGHERLSMSEKDWQQRKQPMVNSLINNFHAPVNQFAQTTGDGSSIHQNLSLNNVEEVSKFIHQLITEIRSTASLTPEAKGIVERTASDLEVEVRKPTPNLEGVKLKLETLKLLLQSAPMAVEIVCHIWRWTLPGIPCPF